MDGGEDDVEREVPYEVVRSDDQETLVEIPAGATLILAVVPNVEAISSDMYKAMRCADSVPFIEEHLTIYNRRRPTEKYHVSLQLLESSPHHEVRNTSGFKLSHRFLSLEGTITDFIRQYGALWQSILEVHPALTPLLNSKQFFTQTYPNSNANANILHRTNEVDLSGELARHLSDLSLIESRHLQNCTSPSEEKIRLTPNQSYSELYFQFYYITDQLIFFAHRYESRGQREAFRLAGLLYMIVFRHQIFQHFLTFPKKGTNLPPILRRWVKQLDYFLSFLPTCTPATESLWDLSRTFQAHFKS